MAANAFVKVTNAGSTAWRTIKNMFVKVTPTTWVSIQDAWVKVTNSGSNAWVKFYSAAFSLAAPVEISQTLSSSELVRLQGKTYNWSPTPSTFQYKFAVKNASANPVTSQDITAYATLQNPNLGNTTTVPSTTTYQTVTVASGTYYQGADNVFQFIVRGTTTAGSVVTAVAESAAFRIPAAPTLSVTPINSTSVTLNITAASTNDYIGTGRYIVYRTDSTSGTVYGTSGGTNGLGGVGASTNTVTTTLTGLVAGRAYTFSVLPVTGTSGYNLSTYTGYPGTLAEINYTIDTGYSFSFGNDIYVSTNGYIGINGAASANGSDALPTTGEYLAVMSRDLQQSSNTSIWYWSDTSKYVVRWEGYDYGNAASTKTYQVTFYSGQSYADVYVILNNGSDGSTIAHYKNGVTKSSYSAALTTGAMRRVYFDGTAPAVITGLTEQVKTSMKQVTALTSGSLDVGYTTLTTATNENNFIQGTISVLGGSTSTASGYVTRGSTLTVSPSGWPANTTFTYQWYRTRDIEGIQPIALGTASTQSSTIIGEYLYCQVRYSNADYNISNQLYGTTNGYTIVPPAPTYTLTNNSNGTFTISSVTSTGASGYYGTWKLGTGADNAIASSSSPTALATNTTATSGAGSVSVSLYSSVLVTYSGGLSTRYSSWEKTDSSVTVTAATAQNTGQMRRVTMPVAFAASSQTVWVGTNGYVSTTVDPTTSPGTSWPSAGGVVIGPAVADLRQTSLSYKADSSNFYVRWQGCALSETAGSVTIDYLMKFTWSSTTVDVYFITNSTTATLSTDAIRYPAGTSYQTWAGSTSITGMTIPTGMTSDSTNNNVDDNRTEITATKPALNLTTNPAYGTATSASGGWTASISTSPNPTGGTYSVVSQTSGSATVNSSTGALTASGLSAGGSSTVTVRYSLSGYNSVDITASGTASAGASTPTIASIAYIPLGNFGTQYTTASSNFTGGQDDGYWTFTTPYTFTYNGTAYNTIYVGTNSYVTFGGSSTAFSGLSASNPAFNKVMVYAADRSSNSVYWYTSSTVWNIKLNCGSTSGTPGSDIQWELYGNSGNGVKRIDVTIVAGSGGTTMAASASTSFSSLGGNGTAWSITSQ